MSDWLRPLLMMFYAPVRGMAEVRDRAPLLQAALLASLLQVAHALLAQWRELGGLTMKYGPWATTGVLLTSVGSVLLVGAAYVPLSIFFANLFERRAGFGQVLRQEYAAAAATTLYALAAATLLALPLAYFDQVTGLSASVRESLVALNEMLRRISPQGPTDEEAQVLWASLSAVLPRTLLALLIQPLTLFSLWAVAAVREVFRVVWWKALLVVILSTALMFIASPLLGVFSTILASPFLALLVFFLVRGYLGDVMRGQRERASFRQSLEAATLNPADASAHYNLGLLHLNRKEQEEARARFLRAIEIDADEIDSHYQLGRIARTEERLPEAIGHFGEVVTRDDAHAQHEVWREIGATYLAAGQFTDAQDALQRFLDKRSSDPEALYLMGRASAGLGHTREAVEWMTACVEAVRTAPAYKYRADKRWLDEAQQFLRTQA